MTTFDPFSSKWLSHHSLYVPLHEGHSNRTSLDPSSIKQDTFLHLIVGRGEHHVSVQIHITPFELPKYPEQTFYASKGRYRFCCLAIKNGTNEKALRDAVQDAYNSIVRLHSWDFSSDHYLTEDQPLNISSSERNCFELAVDQIKRYNSATTSRGVAFHDGNFSHHNHGHWQENDSRRRDHDGAHEEEDGDYRGQASYNSSSPNDYSSQDHGDIHEQDGDHRGQASDDGSTPDNNSNQDHDGVHEQEDGDHREQASDEDGLLFALEASLKRSESEHGGISTFGGVRTRDHLDVALEYCKLYATKSPRLKKEGKQLRFLCVCFFLVWDTGSWGTRAAKKETFLRVTGFGGASSFFDNLSSETNLINQIAASLPVSRRDIFYDAAFGDKCYVFIRKCSRSSKARKNQLIPRLKARLAECECNSQKAFNPLGILAEALPFIDPEYIHNAVGFREEQPARLLQPILPDHRSHSTESARSSSDLPTAASDGTMTHPAGVIPEDLIAESGQQDLSFLGQSQAEAGVLTSFPWPSPSGEDALPRQRTDSLVPDSLLDHGDVENSTLTSDSGPLSAWPASAGPEIPPRWLTDLLDQENAENSRSASGSDASLASRSVRPRGSSGPALDILGPGNSLHDAENNLSFASNRVQSATASLQVNSSPVNDSINYGPFQLLSINGVPFAEVTSCATAFFLYNGDAYFFPECLLGGVHYIKTVAALEEECFFVPAEGDGGFAVIEDILSCQIKGLVLVGKKGASNVIIDDEAKFDAVRRIFEAMRSSTGILDEIDISLPPWVVDDNLVPS